MDPKQRETQSKAIFKRLNAVEAPPFMARRVMARAQERKRGFREVLVWLWVSALSIAAVVAFTIVVINRAQTAQEQLFALKPYVIHVNLDDAEMKFADSAEVELPDGVSFVSKNEKIKSARRLRLPVSQVKEGRSRLPFVVLSQKAGSVALTVRIYDAQDQLIQTKTLKLNFRSGV